MSITSQEYARLADHSYGRDERGNAVDLGALVGKSTVIGGVEYRVLAYSDRPSGYQGAVYQRADSGEIIVAHRGTEFERERMADLITTDGLMAFSRFNPQADDAIELSRLAIQQAERFARQNGGALPQITHTGHSLGGTLAQISGHYFGQGGETFNAYGAASLHVRNPANGEFYQIPEGGNAFVNHVMGADLVSAGSPQYGQVRTYTNQREIDTLERWGYANNRSQFDLRSDIDAAVATLRGGSHDMHNFLPWNGENRPDTSILADPAAQRLAQQYDPMLDKYRGDVATIRGAIGFLGLNARDVIEAFRDPLPPGEPARRAAEPQRDRRGASLDTDLMPAPDMRDAAHPANGRYQQAFAKVSDIDNAMGRTPDQASERVAAAVTARTVGMTNLTDLVLNDRGTHMAAIDASSSLREAYQRVDVELASAVRKPVEESTQDWQVANARVSQDQAQQLEREQSQTVARGPMVA